MATIHAAASALLPLPPPLPAAPAGPLPCAIPAHALVAAGGVGADDRLRVLELLLHVLHHCSQQNAAERGAGTGERLLLTPSTMAAASGLPLLSQCHRMLLLLH